MKWVDVRIIRTKGQSALVEFVIKGSYRRVFIPTNEVKDGKAPQSVLEKGIVYGDPWEDFMELVADKKQMANELRRRGMWVAEDLNPVTVAKVNKGFDEHAFLKKAGEIIKGR